MQSPGYVQIVQKVRIICNSKRSIYNFGPNELWVGLFELVGHILVDLNNILLVVLIVVQIV